MIIRTGRMATLRFRPDKRPYSVLDNKELHWHREYRPHLEAAAVERGWSNPPGFVPFVLDVSGAWGREAKQVLTDMADLATTHGDLYDDIPGVCKNPAALTRIDVRRQVAYHIHKHNATMIIRTGRMATLRTPDDLSPGVGDSDGDGDGDGEGDGDGVPANVATLTPDDLSPGDVPAIVAQAFTGLDLVLEAPGPSSSSPSSSSSLPSFFSTPSSSSSSSSTTPEVPDGLALPAPTP